MGFLEPIDAEFETFLSALTVSWPTQRRAAAYALLGWTSGGAKAPTIVAAATAVGGSRESARRARDKLAGLVRSDDGAAEMAAKVAGFLERSWPGSPESPADLGDVARKAFEEGASADAYGFAAVLRLLLASGVPLPIKIRKDERTGLEVLVPVTSSDLAITLRRATADGRPQQLKAVISHSIGSYTEATPAACRAARELVSAGVWRVVGDGSGADQWVALSREHARGAPSVQALRRLLTLTGPLRRPDLLAAWGRAKGRTPYGALPLEVRILDDWIDGLEGLNLRRSREMSADAVIESCGEDVSLSPMSRFLLVELGAAQGGMTREELLDAGLRSGIPSSTLSAALTYHPAVRHVARGYWQLRAAPDIRREAEEAAEPDGRSTATTNQPTRVPRVKRLRPTDYTWSPAGELVLRATVPSGPSPVIAVPTAVASVLEGRQFIVRSQAGTATVKIRNARAWGFGPLLVPLQLLAGNTFELSFDVVNAAATLTAPSAERPRDVRG